jgi:uncharacterized membrane protein
MMLLVLVALQSMMLLVLVALGNFFLDFLGFSNFLVALGNFLVLGDFSRMCWSTDLLFNYDVAHYGTCE